MVVTVHAQTRADAILAVGSVIFAKLEFAKFALATRLTNTPGSARKRLQVAEPPHSLRSASTSCIKNPARSLDGTWPLADAAM
jgi:hypothetical protein